MSKENRMNRSFTKELFDASNLPDIGCGIVILLYSNIIVGLNMQRFWLFELVVVALILVAQFGFSSLTNFIVVRPVSKLMAKWKTVGLNQDERTELFKKIHKIPGRKSVEAFSYFFLCAIFFAMGYHYIGVKLRINLCSFIATTLGAYFAYLLALSYSRKICTKYECMLVDEGLNPEIFEAKKIYGLSYNKCFVVYCIIPVVWSSLLFLFMFLSYYYNNNLTDFGYIPVGTAKAAAIKMNQIPRFGIILFLSFIVCAISVYSFLSSILQSSTRLQDAMTHILKNDVFTVRLNPTDYENEFTYNIGLVNDVVHLFRSVLADIQEIGRNLTNPVQQLAEVSQSTAATALEQSSGVKEILATMEETDVQTKEILNRVSKVTDVAEQTSSLVNADSENLQLNLYKMDEITEANITTIKGISDLSEKIRSLRYIINIINNIAEQTRIIAFNAELEASSAGESGKNFHIVANEVRRLSKGIKDSVKRIEDKITEIEESSSALIISSESGTEKIKDGQKLFENLDEKFTEIKKSSEITVESAKQIKEYIFQQSSAFDQIVTTVRQISSGIENISTATNTVNENVIKLKDASDRLENLHKQIVHLD